MADGKISFSQFFLKLFARKGTLVYLNRIKMPQATAGKRGKLQRTAPKLLGNREVYMDRHCGVLAYTTENIDVNGGTVVVRFHGRELRLLVMTGQELRITGVIERIELVE